MAQHSTNSFTQSQLFRGRISVSANFLTFGTMLGVWFSHLPVIANRLSLEPAMIGLALLCIGLIGLVMQTVAGLVILRWGSRLLAMVALPIFILCAVALISSPTVPMFFLSAVLVGFVGSPASGANVTMAAELENLWKRPIMSSFHGFFSLGGLIGSVVGGLLVATGYGDGRGAAIVGAVLLVCALWGTISALPVAPTAPPPSEGPRYALPAVAILGISLIAFFCNIIEGSIGDWSALYLTTVKGSDEGLAAAGFAAFSLAMTVLRFAGGAIVERLGRRTLVVGGGAIMAGGLGIVVLSPWPLISALGFLVVAIGAANISPVLTSAAAQTPGVAPAIGVAAVSTFMTLGFLAGPPVIGFIAQAWGLGAGWWFVAALGILVAIGARMRRWDPVPVLAE